MNEKEVLELLLDVLENMSYYPSEGDSLYESLHREIEKRIEVLKITQTDMGEWSDIENCGGGIGRRYCK